MSRNSATAATPRYTVWDGGRVRRGTAADILTMIQKDARPDSEAHTLPLDEYVDTLIDDAAYFMPNGVVPDLLSSHEFPSKYDRALHYLAFMPSSGLQILSPRKTQQS